MKPELKQYLRCMKKWVAAYLVFFLFKLSWVEPCSVIFWLVEQGLAFIFSSGSHLLRRKSFLCHHTQNDLFVFTKDYHEYLSLVSRRKYKKLVNCRYLLRSKLRARKKNTLLLVATHSSAVSKSNTSVVRWETCFATQEASLFFLLLHWLSFMQKQQEKKYRSPSAADCQQQL